MTWKRLNLISKDDRWLTHGRGEYLGRVLRTLERRWAVSAWTDDDLDLTDYPKKRAPKSLGHADTLTEATEMVLAFRAEMALGGNLDPR